MWTRLKAIAGNPWLVFGLSLSGALFAWFAWTRWGLAWGHGLVAQSMHVGNADITAASSSASVAASAASAPHRDVLNEISQTGQAYGGGSALFAAIAGGLVFWAGFMQARALKESRGAYAHQQFESTFFELLKLTRELQERFKTEWHELSEVVVSEQRKGAAALDAYAASIVKRTPGQLGATETARCLVKIFRGDFYNKNPSAFGPYFRAMYQTFKHIADSKLKHDDQKRFANIARGQISEGAVLLLALNGLNDLGFSFIAYIERFGLLEHMHRHYLARFKTALLVGYHERAFMGSTARKTQKDGEAPKQGADFFIREIQEPIAAGGDPANPDLADDESIS